MGARGWYWWLPRLPSSVLANTRRLSLSVGGRRVVGGSGAPARDGGEGRVGGVGHGAALAEGGCILLEVGPAPLPGRHWRCLAFEARRGGRHWGVGLATHSPLVVPLAPAPEIPLEGEPRPLRERHCPHSSLAACEWLLFPAPCGWAAGGDGVAGRRRATKGGGRAPPQISRARPGCRCRP